MRALVHVVDDNAAFRGSISALLESVGIEAISYDCAEDFLGSSISARPGCFLFDLRLPDMGGLELQSACVDRGYSQPIIFLTGFGEVDVSVQAMRQGATQFLTKPVGNERLLSHIRQAVDSDRKQRASRNRQSTVRARIDLLTAREREVLSYVLDGCANKEIGRFMGISHKTVELHRSNMMHKMHADSLAMLVRMCVEVGFLGTHTGAPVQWPARA
ncbi:response regulator transcription factor [Salinisphaera sp.]|uniref:response regulator transcription factor n=1 Tax=Salinisphaera sp. TaxID=1914330 RepID=UPI002D76DEFA|nr:response regulator [Salinisphaera sp.]HET7312792.1 response regulator [Salinisphaera sp.]